MEDFLIKERALIASVMALTLTAVLYSEVKQTDIQTESKAETSQENFRQTDENNEDIVITLAQTQMHVLNYRTK